MIKYSSEILLFTKVKRAQPHVSSLCKLGYSAQFSITAPTELNTLCFASILIHYTSVGGDVITTKSAAIEKSVPTLQINLNFETYRKNITKSMTCHPLFYIKKIENLNTITLVSRGG